MNPLIQLTQTSFVFLAAFGLACVGLTPSTHALLPPPPPDGGYPGGNTAEGQNALFSRTTGNSNTALGFQALKNDTTGGSNTAAGNNALFHNSVGGSNTAVGVSAAFNNIAGVFNTAVGNNALFHAISGIDNTAVGVSAAFSGDGDWNTAVGMQALYINNASGNSALGFQAMFHNTTGSNDVAVGYQSLSSNTTGSANTAVGDQALSHNTTGIHNTACGASALNHITTGGFNIALGQFAGANLTTGSNNIEIGHAGFAGDHDTIRIGGSNGIGTFIDGIYGVSQVGPSLAVYVSSGGQLVTSSSSRRFKKEIKPMDEVSEAILALKPVTFHYKTDKTKYATIWFNRRRSGCREPRLGRARQGRKALQRALRPSERDVAQRVSERAPHSAGTTSDDHAARVDGGAAEEGVSSDRCAAYYASGPAGSANPKSERTA